MDWKTILLFAAILVIVVVFYLQFQAGCSAKKREEGLDTMFGNIVAKNETVKTDADTAAVASMLKTAALTNSPGSCPDADYSDPNNLPLREYYIKSSFNSAYQGGDVSIDGIAARLSEGYRFLDFNLYSASGQEVFVGFSQGNTPMGGSGNLRFSEALKYVTSNAFIKPTKQNIATQVSWDYTKRPLIINLRVFRAPGSAIDIVANIANIINPNAGLKPGAKNAVPSPSYSSNYYVDSMSGMATKIDGCTTLGSIGPRILFTMNIENILQVYTPSGEFAQFVPEPTIAAMNTFVNFFSGGSTCVAFYKYTDPSLTSRTKTLTKTNDDMKSYQTNVQHMSIVFPHPTDDNVQPDIKRFALDSSVLLLPMRTYIGSDANLSLNTRIFNDSQDAFVPASKLRASIERITNSQTHDMN